MTDMDYDPSYGQGRGQQPADGAGILLSALLGLLLWMVLL